MKVVQRDDEGYALYSVVEQSLATKDARIAELEEEVARLRKKKCSLCQHGQFREGKCFLHGLTNPIPIPSECPINKYPKGHFSRPVSEYNDF